MKRIKQSIFLLLLVFATQIPGMTFAWAESLGNNCPKYDSPQWKLSFGLGETHRIPRGTSIPHLEFNITSLEYRRPISPRKSIGYELSFANQTNGGTNNAVSVTANYIRSFIVEGRLSVNCKMGLGVMYLKDKIPGQSTKGNFNEQLGIEFKYDVNGSSAVVLDYNLYHASNGGIKRPNHGINSTIFMVGYCWQR